MSGDLGAWQERLRDEPTQQAFARVPYLGVSRSPTNASFPREQEAMGVQEQDLRIMPYDEGASLPSNIKFEFFIQQEHVDDYLSHEG